MKTTIDRITICLTMLLAIFALTEPVIAQVKPHIRYTPDHRVKWQDGTVALANKIKTNPDAKSLVEDEDGKPGTNYVFAYEDLKGNGGKQLIIQGGSSNCGTAGCLIVILEQRSSK